MPPKAKNRAALTSSSIEPDRSHSGRGSAAIVGGGIAGLTAARELKSAGFEVQVLDKGRGPGGRASTRREGVGWFDHGAQYFTARDDRFRRQLATWIEEGAAAAWEGRIAVIANGTTRFKNGQENRFVGVPGMSAVVRRLASGADVHFGVRVDEIERKDGAWRLLDDSGKDLAAVDVVVLALPPEQTCALLQGLPSPLTERVRPVRSDPCWAVLATFNRRLPIEFDGAFVEEDKLAWVARDSSKPHRPAGERWVLHASPGWSRQHLEDDPDFVSRELLQSFFGASGVRPVSPGFLKAHRWRFAKVDEPLEEGCFWDDERRLGICGDWCHGCRIEGAFLSGLSLAKRVTEPGTATR